jgi:hypothetical protein
MPRYAKQTRTNMRKMMLCMSGEEMGCLTDEGTMKHPPRRFALVPVPNRNATAGGRDRHVAKTPGPITVHRTVSRCIERPT